MAPPPQCLSPRHMSSVSIDLSHDEDENKLSTERPAIDPKEAFPSSFSSKSGMTAQMRREDKDREDAIDIEKNTKYYRWALPSNVFFFISSILYLWLAIEDMYYEHEVQDLPDDVLGADDLITWQKYGIDDDYVFDDIWVSKYQIIYFLAA